MSNTTPRDDIAGLIERLRAKAEKAGRKWSYYPLVTEAATQLDSLSARERESFQKYVDSNEARIEAERERDALSARVKELERDVEAFQLHEQTLRDNGIASHSEAVVRVVDAEARAIRAEQERDEAKAALRAEQSRGSYHCD